MGQASRDSTALKSQFLGPFKGTTSVNSLQYLFPHGDKGGIAINTSYMCPYYLVEPLMTTMAYCLQSPI